MGNAQGIIQFSNGQEPGVGSDGGAVKLPTDFVADLESERGIGAVTNHAPQRLLRYLKKHIKIIIVLSRMYCQAAHEATLHVKKLLIYRITLLT